MKESGCGCVKEGEGEGELMCVCVCKQMETVVNDVLEDMVSKAGAGNKQAKEFMNHVQKYVSISHTWSSSSTTRKVLMYNNAQCTNVILVPRYTR